MFAGSEIIHGLKTIAREFIRFKKCSRGLKKCSHISKNVSELKYTGSKNIHGFEKQLTGSNKYSRVGKKINITKTLKNKNKKKQKKTRTGNRKNEKK